MKHDENVGGIHWPWTLVFVIGLIALVFIQLAYLIYT